MNENPMAGRGGELIIEPSKNDSLPPCPRDGSERIASVAVWKAGTVYSLPAPARHHHVTYSMVDLGIEALAAEQGFLTSAGRFVRRRPALRLAQLAKQLKSHPIAPASGLYSEDVW